MLLSLGKVVSWGRASFFDRDGHEFTEPLLWVQGPQGPAEKFQQESALRSVFPRSTKPGAG